MRERRRLGVLTHSTIGLANPYLICEECRQRVPYLHDPDICNCLEGIFNYPCGHKVPTISRCPTWNSIDGCMCGDTSAHSE